MDGVPDQSWEVRGVSRRLKRALRRPWWSGVALCLLGVCLMPLTACSGFFTCEKASCSSGGGGTNTGDFAYVAYTDTNGTSYITGYNVGSGALTVVKTLTLPFVPVALAVAPSNQFLYVASVPGYSSPGIYLYSIGTDGSLTAASSSVLQTDFVGAMTLSADGTHLFTLNSFGQTMAQYTVNASTGALSTAGALTVPSLSCGLFATTPVAPTCGLAASPNNNFVVASFGTQGDFVFPYSSSSGITTTGAQSIAAGTSSGDFAVAIDASNNAYIAQTASMTVYGLTSTALNNRGTIGYASGSVPRSVTIGPNSKFVFTANLGAGTISSFTTGTTTAVTQVSGSPFAGPARVASLGVDNTGSYLVAAGYDASAGVQLFSIANTGVLSSIKSAGTTTATAYPVLVAMTH